MKNEINVENLFKSYYDDFIRDLNGLLRIPSVLDKFDSENKEAPFGKEIRKALDYMIKLGKRDGFTAVNLDNYCGYLEFGEGEDLLVILCHLDVVPATGEWTNPPFEPIIKDGRIYARGSIDDKGPLMATYYALKMLKDSGYVPAKRVRFFFGCDEETASRGLHHYLELNPKADYGFSPDANFPVIYAEKGISNIQVSGSSSDPRLVSFVSGTVPNVVPDKAVAVIKDLDVKEEFARFAEQNGLKNEIGINGEYVLYGKAAHGSIPETGKNAALYLAYFLSHYLNDSFLNFVREYLFFDFTGERLEIDCHDDEMGDVSNNCGIFDLHDGKYSIVMNVRYPKNFDFTEKMMHLKNFLSGMNINLLVLYNSKCHYVSKGSVLVQSLLSSYRKWTTNFDFESSEPISIGGGTYARDFENAVAFGPVFPEEKESMHMPDESADIGHLILASFIYQDAIKKICG